MDDRTRFAKCFVITAENCKSYVLTFVKNRACKRSQTLDQYIQNHPDIINDRMVQEALKTKPSSKDFDISVLCVIVRIGKLLKKNEKKSTGHKDNTAGDIIDRVRAARNSIAHTGKASLDKDEYEEYLAEFLSIAEHFERINCLQKDTYKREIEKIDEKKWADKDVEDQIKRFRVYVETVIKFELTPPPIEIETSATAEALMRMPKKRKESFTREMADFYSGQFDNPLAQAAAGVYGGTTGLVVDGLNFLFRFRE